MQLVADAALSRATSSGPHSSDEMEVKSEHIPGMTNIEVFGHRFHYQEIIWLVFLLFGFILLICAFASANIPSAAYSVPGAVIAVLSLVLLWNYYLLKSLATSAEKLKGIVTASKQQLREQEEANREATETNNRLSATNNALQERVTTFQKQCGLLDVSVQDLGAVEHKLRALYDKHQETLENERKLNAEQELFLLKQEEIRLDREKRQLKLRLRDQFEDADLNRDGNLNVEKELGRFKTYLSKAGVQMTGDEFKGDADGNITKWRCMDIIDGLLDAHFAAQYEACKQKVNKATKEREEALEQQRKEKEQAAKIKVATSSSSK